MFSLCSYNANGAYYCNKSRTETFEDSTSDELDLAPIYVKFTRSNKIIVDWTVLTKYSYTRSEIFELARKQPWGTIHIKSNYDDGKVAKIYMKSTSANEDVKPWTLVQGTNPDNVVTFTKSGFNKFLGNPDQNDDWGTVHFKTEYTGVYCKTTPIIKGGCYLACTSKYDVYPNGRKNGNICSCRTDPKCRLPPGFRR